MKHSDNTSVPQEVVQGQQPNRDEMKTTCMWLLDHKLPPLPVAPKQDPFKYPKKDKKGEIDFEADCTTPKALFTGKNPSYLDKDGIPHLINHNKFQKMLPTKSKIEKWFANPANGIGTLGGWHGIVWIDIDTKQFADQAECDAAFYALLEKNPELRNTFLEQSHSGGYRVGVRTKDKPTFTNFALEEGGKHVGEALGAGRFTVLAPTVGVSGKPYININRPDEFLEVDSLDSLGLFPTKNQKKSVVVGGEKMAIKNTSTPAPRISTGVGGNIAITSLITDKARGILENGDCATGDHSEALTTFLNELSGWCRWCEDNDIAYSGDYYELAHDAGSKLGIDHDRIDRIINGIHTERTIPSCQNLGGDMACWKKVRKINKGIFDLKCPDSLKKSILEELKEWKKKPSGQGFAANNLSPDNDGELDPNYVNETPERSVLAALFGDGKKDWTVINQAYYRYQPHSGHWLHINDAAVERLICEQLMELYTYKKEGEEWVKHKKYSTDAKKTSSFKFCKSKLTEPKDFYNAHLLAFLNGTVDTRTGELQEHDKNNLLTSAIASNYVKGAECPEVFRQFVINAFGEEFLSLIRALTALYLDPTAPYGYFAHVIGSSGSGKGTLVRFWGSMFGLDGVRSLCSFGDISTPEGRHQYLTGARFISFPDMGGWQGTLKSFYELIDNGSLSGRALFSSSAYEKRWHCRFAMASVDYLSIENSGDGWDRRCIPLPTKLRGGAIDPDLGKKLEEVRGEVISWALGMPRAERDNLIINSAKTNDKIAAIKREQSVFSDSVKAFVDMCLRPSESAQDTVENHKLHDWYTTFCKAHGFSPMSSTKFISHFKNVLPNNRVARRQYRKDGKVFDIPAHWNHISILTNAFIRLRHMSDFIWECQKGNCTEGGLQAFEEFWQQPEPVTSVTSTQEFACDTPVTAEPFVQQEFLPLSQASQASQRSLNLLNNAKEALPNSSSSSTTPHSCGVDKNDVRVTSPCDGCDSASNPYATAVTGHLKVASDVLVTPCDGCDGQLPPLNIGDEVEVYFYGSWQGATVVSSLATEGEFSVQVQIQAWDKMVDIYDPGSLRIPPVSASLGMSDEGYEF